MCNAMPKWFVLVGLVQVCISSGYAQVLYGSLVGTAEDTSGSIVPGAAVTVSSESTGVTKQGTSGQDGNFSFSDLLPVASLPSM